MIVGARKGVVSGLRRLISFSMSQDLKVYIIPGPEIACARGLDIEAAGMQIVSTPRHASILLVISQLPIMLRDSAAVVYAQMPRPRVILSLGVSELSPLPAADIEAEFSQQGLIDGVKKLREIIKAGAFSADASDFDAPILQSRIEYTCSMHPEISEDQPGSCPKCGMNLIPREASMNAAHSDHDMQHRSIGHSQDSAQPQHSTTNDSSIEYTCPMHPEVVQSEPGSCPKCGMNLEVRDTASSASESHDASVEYTCPMHPEVVQNKPGSCPKCGMNLEVRDIELAASDSHEASVEYTCPMHPEVVQSEPGSCPKCGMTLEVRDIESAESESHDTSVEYTCPMHPEVVQSKPGSCPKCGMNLEVRDIELASSESHDHHTKHDHAMASAMDHNQVDHSKMDHGEMDHNAMPFMSMIDVTKDLPRSSDGLPMDWIDVPFGPFFPGLPGGLALNFTLDGDTVAGSSAKSLVANELLNTQSVIDFKLFIQQVRGLDPLVPNHYQILTCMAFENAIGMQADPETVIARVVISEKERIVSHLGWLLLFAQQTGFCWLHDRLIPLQKNILLADKKQLLNLKPQMISVIKRLQRTPLLKSRTSGFGKLIAIKNDDLLGPVARASGINNDLRNDSSVYKELGFVQASRDEGDVLARLSLRLDEIQNSFELIENTDLEIMRASHLFNKLVMTNLENISGTGEAALEMPRGKTRLALTMEKGRVVSARFETPSTAHLKLVEDLTQQQELGDALLAVGSLDLSPWEIGV